MNIFLTLAIIFVVTLQAMDVPDNSVSLDYFRTRKLVANQVGTIKFSKENGHHIPWFTQYEGKEFLEFCQKKGWDYFSQEDYKSAEEYFSAGARGFKSLTYDVYDKNTRCHQAQVRTVKDPTCLFYAGMIERYRANGEDNTKKQKEYCGNAFTYFSESLRSPEATGDQELSSAAFKAIDLLFKKFYHPQAGSFLLEHYTVKKDSGKIWDVVKLLGNDKRVKKKSFEQIIELSKDHNFFTKLQQLPNSFEKHMALIELSCVFLKYGIVGPEELCPVKKVKKEEHTCTIKCHSLTALHVREAKKFIDIDRAENPRDCSPQALLERVKLYELERLEDELTEHKAALCISAGDYEWVVSNLIKYYNVLPIPHKKLEKIYSNMQDKKHFSSFIGYLESKSAVDCARILITIYDFGIGLKKPNKEKCLAHMKFVGKKESVYKNHAAIVLSSEKAVGFPRDLKEARVLFQEAFDMIKPSEDRPLGAFLYDAEVLSQCGNYIASNALALTHLKYYLETDNKQTNDEERHLKNCLEYYARAIKQALTVNDLKFLLHTLYRPHNQISALYQTYKISGKNKQLWEDFLTENRDIVKNAGDFFVQRLMNFDGYLAPLTEADAHRAVAAEDWQTVIGYFFSLSINPTAIPFRVLCFFEENYDSAKTQRFLKNLETHVKEEHPLKDFFSAILGYMYSVGKVVQVHRSKSLNYLLTGATVNQHCSNLLGCLYSGLPMSKKQTITPDKGKAIHYFKHAVALVKEIYQENRVVYKAELAVLNEPRLNYHACIELARCAAEDHEFDTSLDYLETALKNRLQSIDKEPELQNLARYIPMFFDEISNAQEEIDILKKYQKILKDNNLSLIGFKDTKTNITTKLGDHLKKLKSSLTKETNTISLVEQS